MLPNVLRTFCLHFISSNMHYYGGVEEGTVVEQTQVLTKWYLAPMQLFCMNFGSSHAIHHFVPGDPFYVRMMTVRVGHEVMRANGVRFNDMGRSDGRTASTPLRRHPLRRNRPGAIRSKAVHRRRVSLQSRLHVEVAESADALA